MDIILLGIYPSDGRSLAAIPSGEVVRDRVELCVDGRDYSFEVLIHAHAIGDLDASVLSGDSRMEELFRYMPGAMARICRSVAQARRGEELNLPLTIARAEAAANRISP